MDHWDLSDQDFMTGFEKCSINPQIFNHEAHLRLAWLHIQQNGKEKARQNLCKQILKFDQTFGDGNKFDQKLTIASIEVLNSYILKSNSSDFGSFLSEFPELKTNFVHLVKSHLNLGNS